MTQKKIERIEDAQPGDTLGEPLEWEFIGIDHDEPGYRWDFGGEELWLSTEHSQALVTAFGLWREVPDEPIVVRAVVSGECGHGFYVLAGVSLQELLVARYPGGAPLKVTVEEDVEK